MIKQLKQLIYGLRKESKSKKNREKLLSYKQTLENTDENVYMYVLVNRPILPILHCGIQASHAVAEYIHFYNDTNTSNWVLNHKYLIMLEASEEKIIETMKLFSSLGMKYQPFREPDMSNSLTAVAFQPMKKVDGRFYFGSFNLLS